MFIFGQNMKDFVKTILHSGGWDFQNSRLKDLNLAHKSSFC